MKKGDKIYYMYLTLGGDIKIYRAEYVDEDQASRTRNLHSIKMKEKIYDNMRPEGPTVGKSYRVSGDYIWPPDKITENIEKYKTILFRMIFKPFGSR